MQYRYLKTRESRSCSSISDRSRDPAIPRSRDDAGRERGATVAQPVQPQSVEGNKRGNFLEGHENTIIYSLPRSVEFAGHYAMVRGTALTQSGPKLSANDTSAQVAHSRTLGVLRSVSRRARDFGCASSAATKA
jgi:hypothetical protein